MKQHNNDFEELETLLGLTRLLYNMTSANMITPIEDEDIQNYDGLKINLI